MPFRQITGKIDITDSTLGEGTLRAALGLLAERGLTLFKRGALGRRELFLVAPADSLVPASTVPDLLQIERPRLRWPKRLFGNPKIGRLVRVRPPKL